MDQASDATDDLAHALREMAADAGEGINDDLVPPGQRPCPICRRLMETVDQQGVTMDLCPDHGVWLDQGELALLLERAYWHRRDSEQRPGGDQREKLNRNAGDFRRHVHRAVSFLKLR